MSDEPKTLNVQSLTIPIVSVVAVVGALLGGVLWIQSAIAGEGNKLSDCISEVAADVQSLRERVIAIDASRFTAGDGLEVWRQIATIKETCVRIEQRQVDIAERLKTIELRKNGT